MDLYSGQPYWLVKNPLDDLFDPLRADIRTDVAVIGSGITGALVAHELCRRGIDCIVVDKRSMSTGSSVASTALLQYEIDVPLCELIAKVGEDDAVEAYRSCLKSIDDLAETFAQAGLDPSFKRVPSLFYARRRRDKGLIEEEYETRVKYGLPVRYLDKETIAGRYGIDAPVALENDVSGELDPYRAATGLLNYNRARNGLRVYTHTKVTQWQRASDGYSLHTAGGHTIRAGHVVVAAGFEAGGFLPGSPMSLTTTFAVISEPVDPDKLWPGRGLIWETGEAYLYIRTDGKNRIIVGGEDISANDKTLRRFLIDKKSSVLEEKFRKLMPRIPFKTEFAWAGTFSSTADGLPLIGPARGDERMLFALGYGGNGITFSMIAAQILAARLSGGRDPRERIFSLSRPGLE